MNQPESPKTLMEAVRYFADPDLCLEFFKDIRWPDGVVSCPQCGSTSVYFSATKRLWECKTRHPKRQFSVKVGTVMEDSPIALDKWLVAMWVVANDKNGISSYEVAKAIGVTQKSAWFLMHRIRLAMQTGTFMKMSGTVEVDETFIGGKARFMHKDRRDRVIRGTGGQGKAIVVGILDRHGDSGPGHSTVQATVMPTRRKPALQPYIRQNVEPGSNVYTDALKSYEGLDAEYMHEAIDHAETYVDGVVHTNGLENFWSLLKRSIHGTYISIEPFHLFRYIDEQAFRFNERHDTDWGRFVKVANGIFGKRLTYKELTE